jgi:D-amino-acid oxidase
MPFRCDDPRVGKWAIETLDELLAFTTDHQDLVEILPCVSLMRRHGGPSVDELATANYTVGGTTPGYQSEKLPAWTYDPRIRFQHLTVEMLSWQNSVHRLRIPPERELKESGYLHAWLFYTPIVNTPRMLKHMLERVTTEADEVNVETGKYYESIEDMRDMAVSLGCDAVVNCTGLGAASICQDDQLIGARGILLHFDRAKCVRRLVVRESWYGANENDALVMVDDEPWGSETMPCYLIPRGDKIVVGGSYLKGDDETGIRKDERERLFQNAARTGIDLEESQIVGEWTGFRPSRPIVRCEVDDAFPDGVKVAHNYGHGGSGWTVNAGAARECIDLLLGSER